jgi:hypothetical protein
LHCGLWSEEAGHNNPILLLSTEFSYILNLLWPTFFFRATNMGFTICQCCWSQPLCLLAFKPVNERSHTWLWCCLPQTWLTSLGSFQSTVQFTSAHALLCFFQVYNSFYHVTDPLSSGRKFLAQTRMVSFNSTNALHKLTHETALFYSLEQ